MSKPERSCAPKFIEVCFKKKKKVRVEVGFSSLYSFQGSTSSGFM